MVEIKRLDEQACVSDLSAAAAAQEASELLLGSPSAPGRLLLKRAERAELSLSVDNPLHRGGAESADQLVLEVRDAHVETKAFQLGAGAVGTESGLLEATPEVVLLRGVTEARQPEVAPVWAEEIEEPSDGVGTSDRDNGDALGVEIPTVALGERCQRDLVARPFDQHDGLDAFSERERSLLLAHARYLPSSLSAGRLDGLEPWT